MFSKKWLLLGLVFLVLTGAYFLLKPKPIVIETTPPESRYSQCCRLENGTASCVDETGTEIAYSGVTAVSNLSLCPNNEKPTNKVDFSRHQVLSANDVLASSSCCAASVHNKRCTLPNGNQFEMPLAKTEKNLAACKQ